MDRTQLHELVDALPDDDLDAAYQAVITLLLAEGLSTKIFRQLPNLRFLFENAREQFEDVSRLPFSYSQAFAVRDAEGTEVAEVVPARTLQSLFALLHRYESAIEAVDDGYDRQVIAERSGVQLEEGEALASGVAAELKRFGIS